MHPKERGELTEIEVLAELSRRGVVVLEPYGDNQPYDFVLDINGDLLKVQVKTGKYDPECGVVKFNTTRHRINTTGHYQRAYEGIDGFIVFDPSHEDYFWVELSETPKYDMRIRVDDPAGAGSNKINWAENYKLERLVPPRE